MRLTNTGTEDHSAQLLRHNEGVRLPDVTNALRHGGMAELASLVSFAGGPGHVGPGMEQAVIQELAAGTYAVIFTAVSDEGFPHAVASLPHRLTVAEGERPIDAPEATGEVRLVDDSFEGLPAEVSVGRQVLKVSNDGSKPHELGFRRLDDGVTADMMIDTILHDGKGVSELGTGAMALQMLADLPMASAGGIQVMEPGMSARVVVDLEPGSYVAKSRVPSLANGGTPQAMPGMIQGFTVRPY